MEEQKTIIPSSSTADPSSPVKQNIQHPLTGGKREFNRNGQKENSHSGPRFGANRRSGERHSFARKDDMESKLLEVSRVSHTRAGGRRLRFRAIIATGDKKGKIGLGVASGLDVAQAVDKATRQSRKHLIEVPIVNETISSEVAAKVGPAKIILKPQRKGRGLIAGGVVRLMCQLAGIKNISSKMLGTTKNKLNNSRAVMKAFDTLKRQNIAKNSIPNASINEKSTSV